MRSNNDLNSTPALSGITTILYFLKFPWELPKTGQAKHNNPMMSRTPISGKCMTTYLMPGAAVIDSQFMRVPLTSKSQRTMHTVEVSAD